MKRVILIVIDGLGMGYLPDAADYGDYGSNTFRSVQEGLNAPFLASLGLFDILPEYSKNNKIIGAFGKMSELSKGKDTTTGHFELVGYVTEVPYKTYPNGFPKEITQKLEKGFGTKILGNEAASGTEIIKRLGDLHLSTGYPIVYTSADSVMQIATHTDLYSNDRLYELCKIAKDSMDENNRVGRVIARPFEGKSGSYYRTPNRKDFGILPQGITVLDKCLAKGLASASIGKIKDIFSGKGISKHYEAHGNKECFDATIKAINAHSEGIIFANLVDTDMLYGHRNDVSGYRTELERIDAFLFNISKLMQKEDILIVTSDHGCDPSYKGTDHTREYVPLLVYGQKIKSVALGTLEGFFNVADIIAEHLSLPPFRDNPLYHNLLK